MKAQGARAIGLGLVTSMALLTLDHAYADENGLAAKCTLDTLKGQYLIAGHGTLFGVAAGVFNVPDGSVSEAAGYSHRNRLCHIHHQRR
jgi:hypothetical protein